MTDIKSRKADHLDLCATDDVAFKQSTTLLADVVLVHQSLPELHADAIDLSSQWLGKPLRAPLVIAGMTGGHERAEQVNRELAQVAQERGYAFGVGSQRAMLVDPELSATYAVRDVAPDIPLMGNLGAVQARDLSTSEVASVIEAIGADAICLHLNPAMEIVQPEGDRDFRDILPAIERLVKELDMPVIAKETGNGISRTTAQRLANVGVKHIDTSGAGGTSWVGVEALRAQGAQAQLGEKLWDWGVPTAASVHYAVESGHQVIATGGVSSGQDVAAALALGATLAGIARPVFQAWTDGGVTAVHTFFDRIEEELRAIMLLTGAAKLADLPGVEKVIRGELRDWMAK